MSQKRSISVRKVIQTAVTLVLLGLSVLVMLSASGIQDKHTLKGVSISVKNDDVCQFVDKKAVRNILLTQRHIDLGTTKLSSVDIHQMEHILSANPWIDTVQVFVDNNRLLHVDLVQRVPELRVFERDGSSYYLDRSLHVLPLSDQYTHYELIFVQVPHLHKDSLNQALQQKMLRIAYLIKRDEFWNAQTAEIAVNSINDFELIPVMGKQKIRLGDTTDLQQKLSNLMAFYRHIQHRIGWDKYEVLDVRFKGQVVASPSLPWKAPVDRALSNMNWVKSIIGDEKVQPVSAATAYPLTGDVAAPVASVKPVQPVVKPAAEKKPETSNKPAAAVKKPETVKPKVTATAKKPEPAKAKPEKNRQEKPAATKPAKQEKENSPQGKPKMVMPEKQHN
jgi:cell division protein FtsQ